jgi:HsdM N-terminal domain
MDQSQLSWITNFIWGIADDVLRDVYVRGKYRDVILPMTVLRRLDALLEETKPAVIELKAMLDKAGVTNRDSALRVEARRDFYNTSSFTLRDLRDTEQVPLLEQGGIETFFRREVLPHVPDAWIDADATRIGYEISFNRYFYKPAPMRTLEEIRADIVAVEGEPVGLLDTIIGKESVR